VEEEGRSYINKK